VLLSNTVSCTEPLSSLLHGLLLARCQTDVRYHAENIPVASNFCVQIVVTVVLAADCIENMYLFYFIDPNIYSGHFEEEDP